MNKIKTKAKKRFGQNFLKNEIILEQIIESMPKNNNKIVEIGPGLGDLTKYLLDVKSVEAFEVDIDLCKLLNNRFKKEIFENKLYLSCGDVLKTWKNSLTNSSYDLVANLPYYIATNIILKALSDEMCKNILVMVQLEVAEKFCANHCDKVFGSLSVITQSLGSSEIIIKVPPSSFEPRPKVDSAVMLIKKNKSRDDKNFETMLKLAFAQPRKTLIKNLSSKYNKSIILEIFKDLDILQTIRPHELSTNRFHQIYKKIK